MARTILLDQLTGRARSRRELSDKLAAKNVPPEIATRLLDRFEEVGLVDDEAFARSWIAGRQAGRDWPAGRSRRSCAARASPTRWRARRSTRSTLPPRRPPPGPGAQEAALVVRVDDVTARRLVGMLARKGYGSGLRSRSSSDELAGAGRDEPAGLDLPDDQRLAGSPPAAGVR